MKINSAINVPLILIIVSALLSGAASSAYPAEKYVYDLDELAKNAANNIKKAQAKLAEEEKAKVSKAEEEQARRHFEQGDLYGSQGKYKEAIAEWQKAIDITKDPRMKDYIRKAESKAKQEELVRKKEEAERQKMLWAEQKEKERQELERQKTLKAEQELIRKQQEQLEKERKAKEDAKRREAEQEKLKAEREHRKQIEQQLKEQKRLEGEKQRKLESAAKVPKSCHSFGAASMAVRPENPGADESAGKETKLNLEDLTYRTEEECLDILSRNPNNEEVLDNLANLYLIEGEMLDNAKELYKNGDYQGAVQEYNKALLIEPGNKKAKMGMKRAQCRMK